MRMKKVGLVIVVMLFAVSVSYSVLGASESKFETVEDYEQPKLEHGKIKELKKGKGLSWFDKLKLKVRPQQSFLISMKFSNGTRRTWVLITKDEIFTYKKRTYYLDYQNAYYDLTHNQYHLEFFDDFAVPIDRKIVQLQDDNISDEEQARAFFSVTPSNLKPLIKMEYVKALAESQELNKYLKLIITFTLITGIICMYIAYKMYKVTGGF